MQCTGRDNTPSLRALAGRGRGAMGVRRGRADGATRRASDLADARRRRRACSNMARGGGVTASVDAALPGRHVRDGRELGASHLRRQPTRSAHDRGGGGHRHHAPRHRVGRSAPRGDLPLVQCGRQGRVPHTERHHHSHETSVAGRNREREQAPAALDVAREQPVDGGDRGVDVGEQGTESLGGVVVEGRHGATGREGTRSDARHDREGTPGKVGGRGVGWQASQRGWARGGVDLPVDVVARPPSGDVAGMAANASSETRTGSSVDAPPSKEREPGETRATHQEMPHFCTIFWCGSPPRSVRNSSRRYRLATSAKTSMPWLLRCWNGATALSGGDLSNLPNDISPLGWAATNRRTDSAAPPPTPSAHDDRNGSVPMPHPSHAPQRQHSSHSAHTTPPPPREASTV